MTMMQFLIACAASANVAAITALPPKVQIRGGTCHAHTDSCLPDAERARIVQRIAANRARLEKVNPTLFRGTRISGLCASDQTYDFYPMGGNVDVDLQHNNFVDIDPDPAILDFNCTTSTYNGHAGIDTNLRSFAEQSIGVPVFAALDGVVIDAHDGEPDMNTQGSGQPSNYVAIDHGFGRDAFYFHLKNGSVAVNVGDVVRAGEQIGLTASSGNSTGPHLHFESQYLNQPYEPFAGPCRPGPSGWTQQPMLNATPHLLDFGVTTTDLNTVPGLPHALPASGQLAVSDPPFYFWLLVANFEAGSSARVVFIRPNATVAYDTGQFPMNITYDIRTAWFWFGGWDVADMHTITGRWHIDLYFNDQLMVHAPVQVVAVNIQNFNRPPLPITAQFDPPSPRTSDVIFCRVQQPGLVDDEDYDLVRYHYLWTVDGAIVRDLVSAGQADAIPRNTAPPGSSLVCNVTPADGKTNGGMVSIATTVQLPEAMTDFDQDGDVDLLDYAAFQGTFTGP